MLIREKKSTILEQHISLLGVVTLHFTKIAFIILKSFVIVNRLLTFYL